MVNTGGNTMKKILSFFAIATMLLVSCLKETVDSTGEIASVEGVFAPGKYTFNVEVAETKAVKTAWENGDKIFVFFDDAATKAATDVANLPYITLNFNGEEWVANDGKAPAELPASGTLSAVFCPFGAGEITKENTTFYISKSSAYFMQDTEVPYVNANDVVSFSLNMAMEVDFAQIFVPAEGLDTTHEYSLSVKNTEKIANNNYAAGLQKTYSAVLRPSDGQVSCYLNNCGAPITGHYYDGGFVFYGIAVLGEDAKLAFELKDISCSGNDQNIWSYSVTDIKSFEGPMAIKLPAVTAEGKWTDLSYANAHKRCRLYEDGTLVINENRFEHADIALKHGNIVATYPQQNSLDYTNTGANQPWIDNVANITAVEFGTALTPASMRGAFCGMSALQTINTANLDVSNCTTMQCAFKNCTSLVNIDVSNFNTSKVTNMESAFFAIPATSIGIDNWNVEKVTDMRYMFRACNKVTSLNFSKWNPASVTDLKEFMRGCSKIQVVDLSTFNTSKVTTFSMMFYQCGNLTTIYASDKFTTESCNETDERLFYQCFKLVGGSGSMVDSGNTKIGRAYARIDGGEDAPGYFTLKQ